MREQSNESIDAFYENVDILSELSDKYLCDILFHIRMSKDIIEHVLTEDRKYCLDLTTTSLVNLAWYWSNKLNSDIDIITDTSKPLKESLPIIKQLSSKDIPSTLVGYDTRKHQYPLRIHSISMKDSASDLGIQLADIVASSISFMYNDSHSKFEQFKKELRAIPFSKLEGFPIQPASSEFLSQKVDNSNDSSPLDFIIKNLNSRCEL